MDPCLEEFAADGFTHVVPSLPHDVGSLAPLWAHHRTTIRAAPLCGVRRSVAPGQAVTNGKRAGQAAGAQRVIILAHSGTPFFRRH